MTVLCKPIGRGNWRRLRLVIDGVHLAPFTVAIGERFTMGGVTWRVVEVRA